MTLPMQKPVAATDANLLSLWAEMIGLGVMFGGRSPWDVMQHAEGAANQADEPYDQTCDDLFNNVPI